MSKRKAGYLYKVLVTTVMSLSIFFTCFLIEAKAEEPSYNLEVEAMAYFLNAMDGESAMTESPIKAEYEIYAEEDVIVEGNVLYPKDTLVTTIVTDETGIGKTQLKKGTYYILEKSIDSPYVEVKTEKKVFSLSENNPLEKVIFKHEKPYVKVRIQGPKSEGFVYQLIAASDITNSKGDIIVTAGTVLKENLASNANGSVKVEDLPNYLYGTQSPMYIVKMVEVPSGYVPNENEKPFDGKTDAILSIDSNETMIELSITDEDGEYVPNAVYKITDKSDNVAASGRTGESNVEVRGLHIGETYYLDVSADGYKTVETVEVSLDTSSALQVVKTQLISTKVTISVKDIVDGACIPGAKLKIVDKDGKTVKSIQSIKTPVEIENLKAGHYSLIQEEAAKGYTKAENIGFQISDTDSTVELRNDRVFGYVDIKLVTSVNRKTISDGEFVIKHGEEIVCTVLTDENGEARTSYLPIGTYVNGTMTGSITYTIQQTKTAAEYEIDSKAYELTFEYLGDNTKTVYKTFTMPNKVKAGETQQTVLMSKKVTNGTSNSKKGDVSTVGTGDEFAMLPLVAIAMVSTSALVLLADEKKFFVNSKN